MNWLANSSCIVRMEIIMDLLEIILLIVGIAIIIISCLIVGNQKENSKQFLNTELSLESIFSEEEIKKLKDQIAELLSNASEETMNTTDDQLSRLSNEKIMAVSEFSDQVLEKISRNHEEVVFLYNMLNDKEKDLKETVKVINQVLKMKKEKTTPSVEEERPTITSPNATIQSDQKPSNSSVESAETESAASNNNEQILALYSEGKSIVEISKLLDLGQGEVKLVIDLFCDKK
jgi:FtsZ-interacting cell division protein ZipA